MALFDKLTAIADAIRTQTGRTEALSLDQMVTEIEGIETGGSYGLTYDMGEFVLDADSRHPTIQHSLGDTPDFIMVWTDDFAERDLSTNPLGVATSVFMMYMREISGLPQYLTSTATATYPFNVFGSISATGTSFGIVGGSSSAYGMQTLPTETQFTCSITGSTNHAWRAGITYNYFVSKAWWNVGGVASAE